MNPCTRSFVALVITCSAALVGAQTVSAQIAPAPPPPPPPPPPPMVQMPEAPRTVGFVEGTLFSTTQPYTWRIGSTLLKIIIPEGFVTDYASIPRNLQGFLRSQDRYSRAALIHDYLYWSQLCSREQSDNLFLIAMIESGVPWVQRKPIYEAVRRAGGTAWRSNTVEKRGRWPRVIPNEYWMLADDQTWAQARNYLKVRGVNDPAFRIDPRICAIGNQTNVP